MIPTGHVFVASIAQLFGLLTPGEKHRLIDELAGLVVGCGDLENVCVGQLGAKIGNVPERLVIVLDHRDNQSLLLTVHQRYNHIDLSCAHLPVRAESLLNLADLQAIFFDTHLQLCDGLEPLKGLKNDLTSSHVSQMYGASNRLQTHLHLPANALFRSTTPALKLDREIDLDLDDSPEDPRQEGSFGPLLAMGIVLALRQALDHNHGAPFAHKLGVGGLLVQVFDNQGL